MTSKPRHEYLLDQKKRLSGRRKAVTFIVGIKCSNGVCLCADELESDSITNRYRQKITSTSESDWGMAWAGSGTSYTVDKFSDKLKQSVKGKRYNRAEIENEIEVCLQFVHQSYSVENGIAVVLIMYGRLKDKDGNPLPTEFHLYKGSSETACIAPEREYCFAGMDVTLAGFVLANTHHFLSPLDYGIRLGIFATSLMKEYATGVGGPTDVFSYRLGRDGFDPMPSRKIDEIEKKATVAQFNRAMTEFWMRHPVNHGVLDEMTKAVLDERRTLGPILGGQAIKRKNRRSNHMP